MNFSNTQIQTDTFPSINEIVLKSISRQYIKIVIVNHILKYAAFFGIVITLNFFVTKSVIQMMFWYVILTLCVLMIVHFYIAILAFKKRKFAIRAQDVIYAKGLIVNSITTVPISRIQHIETSRSWLARKFDLATLNIYTAGASGSDLSIEGLDFKEAQQINDFLSEKVNGDK